MVALEGIEKFAKNQGDKFAMKVSFSYEDEFPI